MRILQLEMKGINSSKLIDQLIDLTNSNVRNLKALTANLTEDQMNWKPNGEVWSINEVLAHLNSYANYYHQNISDKINETKHDEAKELFASSTLGRSTWKSVKLGNLKNVKRKLRARKEHNPSVHPELVHPDSLERFIKTQDVLNQILEKSKNINLRRVKIQISISKMVKLRLGDVFLFVVYHNERHIEQINKLIQHVHFPTV